MEHKKEISLNDAPVLAKAKKDALRLLSFSPRSTEELRARLLRKRYEKETVEKAIGYFSGRLGEVGGCVPTGHAGTIAIAPYSKA